MTRILGLTLLAFVVGCSSASKTPEPVAPPPQAQFPSTIEDAVASSFRTESNRVRDQYRHPVETLKFFGLRPNMTVVEISPGAGWYLEILAPLLAANGHYIVAMPATSSGSEQNSNQEKITTWEKTHPNVAAKITTADFAPPDHLDLAPAGTADMVLTFRSVHNWMSKGAEKAVFQAFFKALKHGGVLGVVEHRANPKKKRDPKAKSGYVLEKDIVALAKSVGFKLDRKSEINANPKDTKGYPEGVWTLPPVLTLKDKDREKYLAIGESDRMTLRFVKP